MVFVLAWGPLTDTPPQKAVVAGGPLKAVVANDPNLYCTLTQNFFAAGKGMVYEVTKHQ